MKTVKLALDNFVIMEGTVAQGDNKGKPYTFVKLESQFANNPANIAALKTAGVKVGGKKESQQATLEIA